MATLSRQDRALLIEEVIRLHTVARLPASKIAAQLNYSPRAIKTILTRNRSRIEAYFSNLSEAITSLQIERIATAREEISADLPDHIAALKRIRDNPKAPMAAYNAAKTLTALAGLSEEGTERIMSSRNPPSSNSPQNEDILPVIIEVLKALQQPPAPLQIPAPPSRLARAISSSSDDIPTYEAVLVESLPPKTEDPPQ